PAPGEGRWRRQGAWARVSGSAAEKQPVCRILRFLDIGVAQGVQKALESLVVLGGNLQPDQDAAVVGALIAVVEQADVPARSHEAQEFQQRAWPLRKDEAQQALVLSQWRMAADHVTQVLLGQVVVGQVQRPETLAVEVGRNLGRLALALRAQANE